MAAHGQPYIPNTTYQVGTTIQLGEHKFVLTDSPERLKHYTQPGVNLTVVTVDHRGTVFSAPENDMGRGLIQFTLSPDGQGVVPHYWMEHQEFVAISQAAQGQSPERATGSGP
jgi:hypothetical protein